MLGPGGIGKTRLVTRLAQDVRRVYEDNVWFFDLSVVAAGGSVVDQVATSLGLQALGEDPAGEVAQFFNDSRALIILDGCEHVVGSAGALVRRLTSSCPQVTVIATSQAMLRLSSEHVYTLEPLPTTGEHAPIGASAVQLFLDRIRDVMPEPSAAELGDIGLICERLDGIPLAIELAATRVRSLTPRQILARLDAPLAFLTRGDVDLPDRQRTLKSAIAWSYELCSEDERELWRRMAVFTGAWTLVSAERMADDESRSGLVVDVVESLLEKSILRRTRNSLVATYTMFDSVRQFGLEMSTAEDLLHARVAHRDWHIRDVTDLESSWFGPDQLHWLESTHRGLPDLRAAIQFSIDRGDATEAGLLAGLGCRITWVAHGRADEARRWALRVLEMSTPDTPFRCQLEAMVAAVESNQGGMASARTRLADAERRAEEFGDPIALAVIEGTRGYVEPDPAVKVIAFERALELQGGVNRVTTRVDIEERLADAHNRLGHKEIAQEMIASLTRRAAEAGDKYETSNLLFNAGITALGRGDVEEAIAALRGALVLKNDLENSFGIAMAQDALAMAAAARQDYTRAATLLGTSQALWGNVGAGASPFSRTFGGRDEVERQARSLLGARAFEVAFNRGQRMPVGQGVEYALGEVVAAPRGRADDRPASPLSKREREVADLVAEGLGDKEIAARLSISRRTAEGHVAKSLMKLGFTSRSQLVAWITRLPRGE
ncbi:MAG: LuxR C-terminal-related transcriptional regulator [Microbacterium sp.]|nr:LuxR C-terminal-related transcriptional regulator [Microbacterium sp.]